MKLNKSTNLIVKFKHNDVWYQITQQNSDKYSLYRVDVNNSDWTTLGNEYTLLGTGNSPVKLENKVYEGKLK